MPMSAFHFTDHAVDRFVSRHVPELTTSEARMVLAHAAQSAVRLREKTALGQEQWRIDEPPATLVTKRDGGMIVCVTVLDAEPDPTRVAPRGKRSKGGRRKLVW